MLMNTQNNIFNLKGFLRRPWVVETLLFFLIAWQESFRLSQRTAGKGFSPRWLKDFYFYNFGDFVNGYIMAYIMDGLANYFNIVDSNVSSGFIICQAKFRISRDK